MQEQLETLTALKTEGANLLGEKKFEEAIQSYEKALEVSQEIYKDVFNPELAEFYYLYANSLFTSVENKNTDQLFSQAVPQGIAYQVDDQTLQEICQEEGKEMKDLVTDINEEEEGSKENNCEQQNQAENNQQETSEQNLQQQENAQVSEGESEEESEEENAEENKQQVENEIKDQGVNQEQIPKLIEGDLQVAWEYFELAKKCLKDNQTQPQYLQLLKKVYNRMGDLEAYRECFQAAIQEYESALNLMLQMSEGVFTREIAMMYYIVGQCFVNTYQFQEAVSKYTQAISSLKFVQEKTENVELKSELEGILADLAKECEEIQNSENEMGQVKKAFSEFYSAFDKPTVDPNDPNVKVKDFGLIKKTSKEQITNLAEQQPENEIKVQQEKDQENLSQENNLKRKVETIYDTEPKSSYHTAKESGSQQMPSSQVKKRKIDNEQEKEGVLCVQNENQ